MAQPPAPGHGQGDQPGRDPGLPGGVPGGGGRDPRLAAFAQHDAMDRFPANAWLAMVLDEVSGPQRRCGNATDDELVGILSRWAALESWAAAGKFAVTAELVRRRALPGHEPKTPGAMPGDWDQGTGHEVAAALSVSLRSADDLVGLSVVLQERLRGIGALLAAGVIDALKARIIVSELSVLDDALAARAEALIVAALAGKTPGQVGRLAAAAVLTVDPDGAVKRREQAQREQARIRFWREQAGTAAMAAYGLPTDAALAANAAIKARAVQYKTAKVSPGAGMDQLRVLAFLDLCTGITAAARIALARADQDQNQGQGQPGGAGTGTSPAGPSGPDAAPDPAGADDQTDDSISPGGGTSGPDDLPGDGDPTGDSVFPGDDDLPGIDDVPGGDAGRGSGHGVGEHSPGSPQTTADTGDDTGPALAASTNLTLPLATLQGLGQVPGHGHGLGPLDPALVRDLAAAAARSPHSTFCLTITDPAGIAIAHGCARPAKATAKAKARRGTRGRPPPPGTKRTPWALTPSHTPGAPGGYGTWTLTLPGGRHYTVKLHPIPVTSCDHSYQTRAYQPGDLLRHLVQIRDGTCTFPSCSRHARNCDFDHAIPYHQGGITCACNGGARSRRCHKVKQSKGWTLTQPRPGWHQWRAPSGRTYTQGPMKYPA